MGPTRVTHVIAHEEFPAPDLAIVAPTGAVESNADHRTGETVLGHAAGNVRVMMLHGEFRFGTRQRPTRAERIRMQIVGDQKRFSLVHALQVVECFFEEPERLVVFKVADVLAEDGEAAFRQAEGVLQLGSDGEDFGCVAAKRDRFGARESSTRMKMPRL